MALNYQNNSQDEKKVVLQENGSIIVYGNIPLVRKVQVVTEFGEPIAWKKGAVIETGENYELCRCGLSNDKPFCDHTHELVDFNGKETADTGLMVERQVVLPGSGKIIVKRDYSLCSDSGFCGNRFTTIDQMLAESDDPRVLSQMIAMIERCPSGSYTYSIVGEGEADIEPDLPQQIALITDITSQGPIIGPIWVTGYIPIKRSDGLPLERRNRVTLCRCGLSKNKPFCDGKHREMKVKE